MIDDNESRILMSDSLKGMVPVLEDDSIKIVEDSMIVVVLVLESNEGTKDALGGSLVGVSTEENSIKIDMQLGLNQAYLILSEHHNVSKKLCLSCHLSLSEKEVTFEGPYSIDALRLVEIDKKNKSCVLGFDLTKKL